MLNYAFITYFYRFVAEAIIVFMLLIPFTFDYYHSSHYWGYIFVVLISGGIFFFLEKFNPPFKLFLLVLPVNIFLLEAFDFPVGLVILFPLVFIWRYANIRSYKNKVQEGLYLHVLEKRHERNLAIIYLQISIVLVAIDVIYTKQTFVVFYIIFQFIILLFGYLFSYIVLLNKKVKFNTFLYIPVLMLIGSTALYYVFEPFHRFVAQVLINIQLVIVFILTKIAQLTDFILPNLERISVNEDDEEIISNMEFGWNELLESSDYGSGIDEAILVVGATCIIVAIIIYFIVRTSKKKREQFNPEEQSVTHHELDKKSKIREGFVKRIFGRGVQKPSHPVRGLVFKFERKAVKNNLGRYSFESIEEWLNRLQVDLNLDTYQKVRYGDLEVSEQEMIQLEQQLKEIELTFNEKQTSFLSKHKI